MSDAFQILRQNVLGEISKLPIVPPVGFVPVPRVWCQVLPEARAVFQRAARYFHPRKVWAAGSFVVGLGVVNGLPKQTMLLRAIARKPYKLNSDFDVIVEGLAFEEIEQHRKFLKENRVDVLFFHADHKLKIPMWNFSKLPAERHADAVRMTKNLDTDGLLRLHDKYKLSNFNYCCTDGIIEYFQWAIEKGLVKDDPKLAQTGG